MIHLKEKGYGGGEDVALCGSALIIEGEDHGKIGREPDYVRPPTHMTDKRRDVTCLRCLTKMTGKRHYRVVLTQEERQLVMQRRADAQGEPPHDCHKTGKVERLVLDRQIWCWRCDHCWGDSIYVELHPDLEAS